MRVRSHATPPQTAAQHIREIRDLQHTVELRDEELDALDDEVRRYREELRTLAAKVGANGPLASKAKGGSRAAKTLAGKPGDRRGSSTPESGSSSSGTPRSTTPRSPSPGSTAPANGKGGVQAKGAGKGPQPARTAGGRQPPKAPASSPRQNGVGNGHGVKWAPAAELEDVTDYRKGAAPSAVGADRQHAEAMRPVGKLLHGSIGADVPTPQQPTAPASTHGAERASPRGRARPRADSPIPSRAARLP